MVPTSLGKEYLLTHPDHEVTVVVESMIARVKPLEREAVEGHARNPTGSVVVVRELALNVFNNAVGYEANQDMKSWHKDFEGDLTAAKRERDSLKKKRDKVERTIPNAEDRVMSFTMMEKIEVGVLIAVAFILWVVGYVSLVQLVKSFDTGWVALLIYLMPAAGVTVLTFVLKTLLGMMRGTAYYKAGIITALVAGLIASVTWLILFAGFVQEAAKPVQLMSLQGGSDVADHTSAAYIIAGVLAEAFGAATAWAYVSYLFHIKTVRSFGTSPEWKELDDAFRTKDTECQKYQRLITLCDSLMGKIEAARGEYIGRAEALYMQLRVEK